jgi:hypothetical protein
MARQVSHPHVCRVWDVGETEGQHFISMEFVDGENLASLLRRIGRLPGDKALEIAQQVTSGLAAAHDKGVLHRDLKPANVMLDGQGQVRLTDFGLAGLAESLGDDDVRSGTPSYMSPEQLQGRQVSFRSDIYSLGLLLYELFTGRRAFEGRSVAELTRKHRDEHAIPPSAIVPDLSAAVERTIGACLEKDPKKRPPSALAVAAMLAGRDPLEAAIAAGETPSPELVAAAGEHAGLRPAVAWACLATVVLGALLVPFAALPGALLARVPIEKPPAALEDRARDLLARIGHTAPAADTAEGLQADEEYLRRLAQNDPSPGRWEALQAGEPPVVQFWYRQSPRPIAANAVTGRVTASDPPATWSGMAGVRYDLRGRLVGLYAVTPQRETAEAATPALAPDWTPLFAEARLDLSALKPVAPEWTPPFFCDTRAAWTGSWPSRPDLPLRVEAAGYRGRPVWFQLVSPWTRPERDQPYVPTAGQRMSLAILLGILVVLLVGGGVLAKRNLLLGRGDRRGAFRLASAFFGLGMLNWLLVAHHVGEPLAQIVVTARGTGLALVLAAMLWLFYLALEPYVRRERPVTIVSWTRLLDGRLQDAIVWRDVLFGSVWGVLSTLAGEASFFLPRLAGRPDPAPAAGFLDTLLGPRQRLAFLVGMPTDAALMGLGLLLLLLVFRLLLRRDTPAGLALLLLVSALSVAQSDQQWWLFLPVALVYVGSLVWLLLRVGLVATIAGIWVADVLSLAPHSLELDSWLGSATVVVVPAVAALAAYAFRAATRGRGTAPARPSFDVSSSRSA